MPYTSNPHAPVARREALRKLKDGWSQSKVARYMGVRQSTISKWLARAPQSLCLTIPTKSSRPHHSPNALCEGIVEKIVAMRKKLGRCAPVIHAALRDQGIIVSLPSVSRTLKRKGLIRERSRWARYRTPIPRPFVERAGDLVQIDTIHFERKDGTRWYIYTLIDLHSRWSMAAISEKISAGRSANFLRRVMKKAPFSFRMVQTDHGQEFGRYFRDWANNHGIKHRFSRVRQSNDNAHVERFNRTLQDECISRYTEEDARRKLPGYLRFYNGERHHLSLNFKSPLQYLKTIPRS